MPKQGDVAGTITADDVAARAGVSRWTVTRAFRKDAPISAKSRGKVLEAAHALGYVPDLLASGLAADRSNLVALLVDDFDNPHKLVMLERLTRLLREEGWGTMIVNMMGEQGAPEALLSASQMRVDAAVVIGTRFNQNIHMTALGARRLRKLVIFARTSTHPDTISISCDDESAIGELTQHILARGYRRPLFLAGPDTISTQLMRKDTFLKIWAREGDGSPAAAHHATHYSSEAAATALRAYLANNPRPDIVICENDILAMGAMDLIRAVMGLRVPQDIAVTGFDDIPLAASPGYDITTYRQPISAMTRALIALLKSGGTQPEAIKLPGRFVPRSST